MAHRLTVEGLAWLTAYLTSGSQGRARERFSNTKYGSEGVHCREHRYNAAKDDER